MPRILHDDYRPAGPRRSSPLGDLVGIVIMVGGLAVLWRLAVAGKLGANSGALVIDWIEHPLSGASPVPGAGAMARAIDGGLLPWLLALVAIGGLAAHRLLALPRWRERSLGRVLARATRSRRPLPLVVGTSAARPVRLSDWSRSAHGLLAGVSGLGKSSLAVALAAQILCRRDEAVVMIDPHATLVDGLLGYLPARVRARGVLLLEAGVPDWVYGISPLYCPSGDDPALRARAAADAHRALYGDSWSDRIHHHISYLFQSLIESGYSYLEAPRVLQDPTFRQHVAGQCTSPATRAWFRELAGKNQAQLQAEIASVYVRISEMVGSAEVRMMLGPVVRNPAYRTYLAAHMPGYAPRELDLEALLSTGVPLLACLSHQFLGGYNTRLCALLLAQLADSVFRRDATLAQGSIRAATFFLDELQSYASSSVIDALQQARKFGCSVLGICTTLQTIDTKVARALQSARLLITFGCTYDDASALVGDMFTAQGTAMKYSASPSGTPTFYSAAEMRDTCADLLAKCPAQHCYVHTRDHRGDARLVRTLTVTRRGSAQERAALQRHSGQTWGLPRELVEQELTLREEWLTKRLYLASAPAVARPTGTVSAPLTASRPARSGAPAASGAPPTPTAAPAAWSRAGSAAGPPAGTIPTPATASAPPATGTRSPAGGSAMPVQPAGGVTRARAVPAAWLKGADETPVVGADTAAPESGHHGALSPPAGPPWPVTTRGRVPPPAAQAAPAMPAPGSAFAGWTADDEQDEDNAQSTSDA